MSGTPPEIWCRLWSSKGQRNTERFGGFGLAQFIEADRAAVAIEEFDPNQAATAFSLRTPRA